MTPTLCGKSFPRLHNTRPQINQSLLETRLKTGRNCMHTSRESNRQFYSPSVGTGDEIPMDLVVVRYSYRQNRRLATALLQFKTPLTFEQGVSVQRDSISDTKKFVRAKMQAIYKNGRRILFMFQLCKSTGVHYPALWPLGKKGLVFHVKPISSASEHSRADLKPTHSKPTMARSRFNVYNSPATFNTVQPVASQLQRLSAYYTPLLTDLTSLKPCGNYM